MGMDDTSNFSEWPHVVSRAMTLLSTISNPVFFLAFSENFKEAFANTFCNSLHSQGDGRRSFFRSSKIAPATSREKRDVCDKVMEMKSTSLKVFSMTSEPADMENNC
jgi:hypothetical protein